MVNKCQGCHQTAQRLLLLFYLCTSICVCVSVSVYASLQALSPLFFVILLFILLFCCCYFCSCDKCWVAFYVISFVWPLWPVLLPSFIRTSWLLQYKLFLLWIFAFYSTFPLYPQTAHCSAAIYLFY